MAFIIKSAKTVRTHWKKSTFGACLLMYGVKFGNEKERFFTYKQCSREELIRREFCAEAVGYGSKIMLYNEKPRRVTVFLNPAVKGGKGTKLFTKTAAPILYLSGMEVNVVKTEYEGQVKEFIKVLESQDTDAIVIAGGDGTLLEAVTGLMRKEDKNLRNNIPIGIIPLGKTNRFAKLLFGNDLNQVRLIAESAMAIIKGDTSQFDVMKIEVGEYVEYYFIFKNHVLLKHSVVGRRGKTTYAVSGLEAGLYRDAEQRKVKNWYFGPLKHYWTYIRTTLRNDWPANFKGKMSYVEATSENTKLVAPKVEAPPKSRTWSWLGLLYNQSPKPAASTSDFVMDSSTDAEQERDIAAVELTVMSSNYKNENTVPSLAVGIGPAEPGRQELISEGWRRVKKRETTLSLGTDSNEQIHVKSMRLVPDQETCEGQWFNIDGEAFEAMPITISLLRNKLRVYTRPVSVT
ncbi:acylglycerol kinase, mitochondrial-like [Haliotis rubra]|uniref:acylglycerol kinase, mitochondrial-like n=1 Tax=Haliotis rubra TaxID=36100 RepID=UPI001EE5C884|nr:acylglycerol kinase, mitochondrial-like [Haliotis rubra]